MLWLIDYGRWFLLHDVQRALFGVCVGRIAIIDGSLVWFFLHGVQHFQSECNKNARDCLLIFIPTMSL